MQTLILRWSHSILVHLIMASKLCPIQPRIICFYRMVRYFQLLMTTMLFKKFISWLIFIWGDISSLFYFCLTALRQIQGINFCWLRFKKSSFSNGFIEHKNKMIPTLRETKSCTNIIYLAMRYRIPPHPHTMINVWNFYHFQLCYFIWN